ncbi:hypothetical protein ACHQM5_021433 [Ranunculus cassubicifolius]
MSISPKIARNAKVVLKDWWLIRASIDVDGKVLAVGGFTNEGEKGRQKFSSAPIIKKYDARTLQSADGVTVFIEGSINEIHCHESGITSEVLNHFWHGFPYNWDDSWFHCGEHSIPTGVSCLLNEHAILKDSNSKETLSKEASKVNFQVNVESSSPLEVEQLHITEVTATETECDNMDSTKNADECVGLSSTRRSSRSTNNKADGNVLSVGHLLGVGRLARCSSKAVPSSVKTGSKKVPNAPFEARRSNRVKIIEDMKDTNKQEKAKNKALPPEKDLNIPSMEPNVNMYDSPLEESSHDDRPTKSQSKAKRRLEFIADASSTPIAKDNNVWSLSPVESSCKRSRSGRLILPPLDFWRNQRAIYDMGRECVGVLNGLPPVESLTRNYSEPLRKRKKRV